MHLAKSNGTGIAIYFVVIYPLKRIQDMRRRGDAPTPAPSDEVVLLTEIRDLLRTQDAPRS